MAAGKGPRIEVDGAKELRTAMKRMSADLGDLTRLNKEVAGIVASDARGRAPNLTGALSRSVRPGSNKKAGYVTAGRKLVPYAGPIHFGWPRRNIEPNTFLYDAADARSGEVIGRYRDRIGDLVRKLDRETPG